MCRRSCSVQSAPSAALGPGEHRAAPRDRSAAGTAAAASTTAADPARGHQAAHLLLIQPQPHERVRRGRQLLHRPRPLADHRDQLLPGSASPAVAPSSSEARAPVDTQNATSARSRCEPSRANSSLNCSSGMLPRDPLRDPRPEQPRRLSAERLHRIVVRARPGPRGPGPAGTGSPSARTRPPGENRKSGAARSRSAPPSPAHTSGPALASRSPGSALLAAARPRGIISRLARIAGAPRPPVRAIRLPRDPQPAAEITGLGPGHLIPVQPRRPAEPEPAQQVHPIRPQRRAGTPVTFAGVAQAARISRSWLYTQPDISSQIRRLRGKDKQHRLRRRRSRRPAGHQRVTARQAHRRSRPQQAARRRERPAPPPTRPRTWRPAVPGPDQITIRPPETPAIMPRASRRRHCPRRDAAGHSTG